VYNRVCENVRDRLVARGHITGVKSVLQLSPTVSRARSNVASDTVGKASCTFSGFVALHLFTSGRQRRLREVLDLEEKVYPVRHRDSIGIRKRERLVVVEDGVHAFDPQHIDRSVENDPLFDSRVGLRNFIRRFPGKTVFPVSPTSG
jgi:hypothetical protein